MPLSQNLLDYICRHREEAYQLLLELARIPAPSGKEEQRAAFCRDWLEAQGAKGVYIDRALNVVYPIGCEGCNSLLVFAAHSDTVFPDTEALPLRVEADSIHCPGIGDDTANVVALLTVAKYIATHELCPSDCGILLVINACEEGLGNLKGMRQLFSDYGSRIREFVTFDGSADEIVGRAVGSRRYRIELSTPGGHSYRDFGSHNAIACLASLIQDLYAVELPPLGRTTYNVGLIQGGTSVNTIAQHADMLYEFRSDERASLAAMEEQLQAVLEAHRARGVDVTATLIGDRPCSGEVDETQQKALMTRAAESVERHYGFRPAFRSGSTDCNIPLSLGIPAVCVGCVMTHGAHTREEWVETGSLLPGLNLAFDMILHAFDPKE